MRNGLWVTLSIIFLFITGLIHSIGLVAGLRGNNETENKLIEMMNTTKLDVGPFFSPTMTDVFTALSSCFSWWYVFAGVLLVYLRKKMIDNATLKGLLGIYVIFFGTSAVVMFFLTFLYPIILTVLTFVFLALAYATVPKTIN
jgi:hypothetical protein